LSDREEEEAPLAAIERIESFPTACQIIAPLGRDAVRSECAVLGCDEPIHPPSTRCEERGLIHRRAIEVPGEFCTRLASD
jgi:hypothetical protein